MKKTIFIFLAVFCVSLNITAMEVEKKETSISQETSLSKRKSFDDDYSEYSPRKRICREKERCENEEVNEESEYEEYSEDENLSKKVDSLEVDPMLVDAYKVFQKGMDHFAKDENVEAFKLINFVYNEFKLPIAIPVLIMMYRDGIGCNQSFKKALDLGKVALDLELPMANNFLLKTLCGIVEEMVEVYEEAPTHSSPPPGMYS